MIDYQRLKVVDLNQWSVFCHENQCYLGRVYMLPKDIELGDFFEMTPALFEDFFTQGKKVKQAITELYQPDKFNYASLGNVYTKLHVHIIPRYQTSRDRHGVVFHDERWGANYAPYDKTFHVSEQVLYAIRDELKEVLSGDA